MPAGWPRRLAVATITIGLMMSVLSNSMTNLALPYIAQDLNITAESSIWIVNATQIALIISLLPVAALADIVGYRHVYRFGLVLFSLASIGCALAPSLPWLLAGRTFQGLGGAAIMAVQPALVRAIYPRSQLGRGLGFNTTVVATSLAAGPSVGALAELVEHRLASRPGPADDEAGMGADIERASPVDRIVAIEALLDRR